jgi:D-arabinose 5-phosphate isomerase GutQ
MTGSSWQIASRSFDIEVESMLAAKNRMDADAFDKAVGMLATAERIGTSGCGHSGIACMHFAHSLCCIERPARFLSPSEAAHGAMGFLGKGGVIVLASRGGATDELMPVIQISRARQVHVIAVTENLSSPLAEQSDIVLPMAITRESDKYDSQGTSSFIVLAAIFDALQVAIMELTDFKNERFAVIHPAGAVGKRLNSR